MPPKLGFEIKVKVFWQYTSFVFMYKLL